MEQRFENLFENEAFKAIEEEKINAIKDFVKNNQGKNANQILGEMIQLNAILNKGKPLNKDEKEAMFEVVLSVLNQNERNKLMTILSLLEKGF